MRQFDFLACPIHTRPRIRHSLTFVMAAFAALLVSLTHISSAHALSFAPGTKFLPYKSERACVKHGGKFIKWRNEVYCTRTKNQQPAHKYVKSYRSCVKAGGRVIKVKPRICLWQGHYFTKNKAATKSKPIRIKNFNDCQAYGGKILKTYPAKCTILGKTFTQNMRKPAKATSKIRTFWVEPYRATCWGVSKRDCLVVNGQLFYDYINGFKFKPGYRYKLSVKVTNLKSHPGTVLPQDSSAYRYDLVRILKRKRVR